MQKSLPFVEPLDHGVYVIDTGFVRPRFDASHLIVEQGRAAFVDTGTNHAVPRLLDALASLGLAHDGPNFFFGKLAHQFSEGFMLA